MHPGAAESALAAPHTRVAAALDGVNGTGDNGTVNRLNDLPLRHGFTPADNPAVERIFGNHRGLLRIAEFPELNAPAPVDKRLLFRQLKTAPGQYAQSLQGNGRSCGESGCGSHPRGRNGRAGR